MSYLQTIVYRDQAITIKWFDSESVNAFFIIFRFENNLENLMQLICPISLCLQTGEFLLCQPEGLVYDSLIYQTSTNGAVVMGLDISSTFQALAFSDSAGM